MPFSNLRWQLGTCVLSQRTDEGFVEVMPDYYGGDDAGGDALETLSPYGVLSRPRDPTKDDEGGGVIGARMLSAHDGDLGFGLPCQDPRYTEALPDPGKGGTVIYAITDEERASFQTFSGSDGSVQIYVPHQGGATASTIAIDVSDAGEESIQIQHGAGMKIEMTGGDEPVVIVHSANGASSIVLKNDEIIINATKITVNGGSNIGGSTALPLAKAAELQAWAAAVVTACAAAPGGVITLPPLAASVATTNLKGA